MNTKQKKVCFEKEQTFFMRKDSIQRVEQSGIPQGVP